MKLRELLLLGELKKGKILTNEIGLDNEVETAMVLEAIDIENWSKQNQLILTSFYALNDLSEKELEDFFIKMCQIGISGLVLKTDRFIKVIPEWFIELCFKYEIPLIKISQEISYEKILLTIYEPLLNAHAHTLRTYYEARQRFNRLEKQFSSLETIMQEFYQIIELPFSLKLLDKEIEICEGMIPTDAIVLSRESLPQTDFMKNDYSLLTLYAQTDSKKRYALEIAIFNNYSLNCLLLVYLNNKQIKETDLVIIENAIDALQEKFNTESLLKKERYTRLNNLADAILQNTPRNPEELDSLLQEAHMQSKDTYQTIVFSTKEMQTQLMKNRILTLLRTLKKETIFFDQHQYSAVLFNFDQSEGPITKDQISRVMAEILTENEQVTFAISQAKPRQEIKELLFECLDILNFNTSFYNGPVVTSEDIGIFKHFIRENQIATLQEAIPPKLAQLAQTDHDLFETFYCFLQHNRNYKQTAEAMFLHAKTIRYRLHKISDYLSIDLTNPLQMVNHEIGAYIIKMRRQANERNQTTTR
ncbi:MULTISPECIES: PucR family transcriptional regulator [Enterococcus]|uniref:PucR family transcriptional regulator n=1 Tax=Enterococcus TaxID=1350 RepID=UPI001896D165|nr:PucR family transcriptional regulator [Enterococcus mundtii]MBO1086091.1 PucR family transcriptional regulator [Enterococcus mundtii]MDV7745182.1 PucR family transcriptional regulator [Enterococcus mundtii]